MDDANPHTGAPEVTFTRAEIEKLEKEGSLITADDALSKLKAMRIFFIPEASYVTSQNCNFDSDYNAYTRNVYFSSPYADYIDLNDEEINAVINGVKAKLEGGEMNDILAKIGSSPIFDKITSMMKK